METSATAGFMFDSATQVRGCLAGTGRGICVAGVLLLIVLAPDRVTAAGSGTAVDLPDAMTPLTARQSAEGARPAAQVGETRGDWSLPVDGLRGRLIATMVEDDVRPQVRLELELENVREVATPIAMGWGSWSAQLDFSLEDGSGAMLPRSSPGGNELSPGPYWLHVPWGSSLRMVISKAAYEYGPDRVLFRPMSFVAWELPRDRSTVYARGTLTPRDPAEPHPVYRAWRGPLALPRLALPSLSPTAGRPTDAQLDRASESSPERTHQIRIRYEGVRAEHQARLSRSPAALPTTGASRRRASLLRHSATGLR
jgi:hypothetical protein